MSATFASLSGPDFLKLTYQQIKVLSVDEKQLLVLRGQCLLADPADIYVFNRSVRQLRDRLASSIGATRPMPAGHSAVHASAVPLRGDARRVRNRYLSIVPPKRSVKHQLRDRRAAAIDVTRPMPASHSSAVHASAVPVRGDARQVRHRDLSIEPPDRGVDKLRPGADEPLIPRQVSVAVSKRG